MKNYSYHPYNTFSRKMTRSSVKNYWKPRYYSSLFYASTCQRTSHNNCQNNNNNERKSSKLLVIMCHYFRSTQGMLHFKVMISIHYIFHTRSSHVPGNPFCPFCPRDPFCPTDPFSPSMKNRAYQKVVWHGLEGKKLFRYPSLNNFEKLMFFRFIF